MDDRDAKQAWDEVGNRFGEVGKMYYDPFPAPKLSGDGVVGLLAETAFGPVFIGGSVGDTGHHKWFFQLGRVF